MSGLSADQALGKTGKELGFLIDWGRTPSDFRELARSGGVAEVLMTGRWHEIRVSELRDGDGDVNALGITLKDIHEQKISLTRLELVSKLAVLSRPSSKPNASVLRYCR